MSGFRSITTLCPCTLAEYLPLLTEVAGNEPVDDVSCQRPSNDWPVDGHSCGSCRSPVATTLPAESRNSRPRSFFAQLVTNNRQATMRHRLFMPANAQISGGAAPSAASDGYAFVRSSRELAASSPHRPSLLPARTSDRIREHEARLRAVGLECGVGLGPGGVEAANDERKRIDRGRGRGPPSGVGPAGAQRGEGDSPGSVGPPPVFQGHGPR